MIPVEIKPKRSVFFGDQMGLSRWQNGLPTDYPKRTYTGNYVISSLKQKTCSTPVIVIHHENVDPSAALAKLSEVENSKAEEPRAKKPRLDSTKTKGKNVGETENRNREWSWNEKTGIWPVRKDGFGLRSFQRHSAKSCERGCLICKSESGSVDGDRSDSPFLKSEIELFRQVYQEHEKAGKLKHPVRFVNLLYFVTESEKRSTEGSVTVHRVTAMDDSNYALETNGEVVGFIIDPHEILEKHGDLRARLLVDKKDQCFAFVLDGVPKQKSSKRKNSSRHGINTVDFYELLYAYRPFHGVSQSTEKSENVLDFANLPDDPFRKILSYLPFRELIRYRRISRRWSTICGSAIADETKTISRSVKKFKDMAGADFEYLLSIVANKVESINLTGVMYPSGFSKLKSPKLFRNLRVLDCGPTPISEADLLRIMKKCPNLKEMSASIKRKTSKVTKPAKVYGLEKIVSVSGPASLTDPDLMSIADHFPKLKSIDLRDFGFLTNSCLSTFVATYGDQLTRLSITFSSFVLARSSNPNIGVFDGINQCRNLEYLSLANTNSIVTNGFLENLARNCLQLSTLVLSKTSEIDHRDLGKLALLPNLKRLNISTSKAQPLFSQSVTEIAQAGHLEELLAYQVGLSAACLKSCVRHCPGLKLLSVAARQWDMTVDSAVEIARTFGQYGTSARLIMRSYALSVLRKEVVQNVQRDLRQGKYGRQARFVVDCRARSFCEAFLDATPTDHINEYSDLYIDPYDEDSDSSWGSDSDSSFSDFEDDNYFFGYGFGFWQ